MKDKYNLEEIIRFNINASLIHDDRIADLVAALNQRIEAIEREARVDVLCSLPMTTMYGHKWVSPEAIPPEYKNMDVVLAEDIEKALEKSRASIQLQAISDYSIPQALTPGFREGKDA